VHLRITCLFPNPPLFLDPRAGLAIIEIMNRLQHQEQGYATAQPAK
jgi:hypothetical protein